jgi:hypothetical protein
VTIAEAAPPNSKSAFRLIGTLFKAPMIEIIPLHHAGISEQGATKHRLSPIIDFST